MTLYQTMHTVKLPCGEATYCEEATPANPDDPKCFVRVEDKDGEQLGFLSRHFNDAFAAGMYFSELLSVCGVEPPADWAEDAVV
jgi:hypothetical protein